MDTAVLDASLFISPSQLAATMGRADAPLILDVRKAPAFEAARRFVAGALRVAPDLVAQAGACLPRGRLVVAYCVHGHEVSQRAVLALRQAGVVAECLEGGFAAWEEAGLPTMETLPQALDAAGFGA
jgi:rhodanese-related sulfurtransferase